VEGHYPVLGLDVCKWHTNDLGVLFFVAEFGVIGSEVSSRPAGSRVSWVRNMTHRPAAGEVKSFVAALMNGTTDQVDSAAMETITSSDNPASGRLIRCEATEKISSKTGKPFTVCRWSSIAEDVQAQAVQLRQQAGFEMPF
jgi:hypothetical protein